MPVAVATVQEFTTVLRAVLDAGMSVFELHEAYTRTVEHWLQEQRQQSRAQEGGH